MASQDTRENPATQVSLELRDALLRLFVAASDGDRVAAAGIRQLESWNRDGDRPPDLRLDDGRAVFQEWGELHPSFEKDEPYLRDRAQRFGAAWRWIQEDAAIGVGLECARAAWDAGLFLEVHELVETAWRATQGAEREPLQAWILATTGLHKLCEGDLATAKELVRDASNMLKGSLSAYGYAWGPFGSALEELAAGLEAGAIRGPEDLRDIPRLEKSPRNPISWL